jgi:hypothetical protein
VNRQEIVGRRGEKVAPEFRKLFPRLGERAVPHLRYTPGVVQGVASLRSGLIDAPDRFAVMHIPPRMLERNLISKSNSPNDKRSIHLSITAHGLKTVRELLPSTVRSQEMIVASLPKEYRRIFKHCLETIIEANEANLTQ